MDSIEFQQWKTDPLTKEVLKYLNDFKEVIVNIHTENFRDSNRPSDEDYFRDSERYITLDQIVNLSHEDIEEFYNDQTSLGPISSQAE